MWCGVVTKGGTWSGWMVGIEESGEEAVEAPERNMTERNERKERKEGGKI